MSADWQQLIDAVARSPHVQRLYLDVFGASEARGCGQEDGYGSAGLSASTTAGPGSQTTMTQRSDLSRRSQRPVSVPPLNLDSIDAQRPPHKSSKAAQAQPLPAQAPGYAKGPPGRPLPSHAPGGDGNAGLLGGLLGNACLDVAPNPDDKERV
mmetsp:Transcript_102920/g.193630  ORF Transcript_102920/g.193630 Transcript_102920/m.193630 type:complete len:153 (-) Transcript_102920:43-501(-)